MWRYILSRQAMRDLERRGRAFRERIFEALDHLIEDPPQGDVRRLTGHPELYRLWVGGWRIIFSRNQEQRLAEVLRIVPRGGAYRDL